MGEKNPLLKIISQVHTGTEKEKKKKEEKGSEVNTEDFTKSSQHVYF